MLPDPNLNATLTTAEAALLLGVSRDALYDAAKTGTAPVHPVRVGRRLVWPTRPLLALLGCNAEVPAVSAAGTSSLNDLR